MSLEFWIAVIVKSHDITFFIRPLDDYFTPPRPPMECCYSAMIIQLAD